jgi:hypothetical protein
MLQCSIGFYYVFFVLFISLFILDVQLFIFGANFDFLFVMLVAIGFSAIFVQLF